MGVGGFFGHAGMVDWAGVPGFMGLVFVFVIKSLAKQSMGMAGGIRVDPGLASGSGLPRWLSPPRNDEGGWGFFCHCEHREAIHGGSLGVHGLIWPRGPVLDCHVGLCPPRNDGGVGLWLTLPSLRVKRSNPWDWLLAHRLIWTWGPSLDCRSTPLTTGHVCVLLAMTRKKYCHCE